jgi:hypothetical protein
MFYDLQENFADYQAIFAGLGYTLVESPNLFYYLNNKGSNSEVVQQMLVFFWVLIDYLSDHQSTITAHLLTQELAVSELPHFTNPRYVEAMQKVKIASPAELRTLVQNMGRRFGFVRSISGDDYSRFAFLPPAYRMLDATPKIQEFLRRTRAEQAAPQVPSDTGDAP